MKPNRIILSSWQKSEILSLFCRYFLIITVLYSAFSFQGISQVIRKSGVEFYTIDSLLITADHYYANSENPYILLFHQESSSRGEFNSIARRFVKMNYNCLAVDLRSGDEFEYIDNLSAQRAKINNQDHPQSDEKDILAAINYAYTISKQNIILLGSSSSATLCLKVASENDKIKAVIALSPGDYFIPGVRLKQMLESIRVPVIIASNSRETEYIYQTFKDSIPVNLSLVDPPKNSDKRGVSLLYTDNPGHNEYWLSILVFIKSLSH